MAIYAFEDRQPVIAASAYISPTALVIGDVAPRHRDMSHWAKDIYVALAARYSAGGMVRLDPVEPTWNDLFHRSSDTAQP